VSDNGHMRVVEEPEFRWYHKLASILFAVFCFEVGVLLLVFPWMDSWEVNYFSSFSVEWKQIWASNYFRGALSGLGLLNIYISCAEVFRFRRFSA